MGTNRRDFIKFVVAGSVAAGCPVDLSLLAQTDSRPMVDGEDNRICHQVRDGRVFERPPVSARHDVVIVGGGVSGLSAAHLLQQHHDILLLEKEPHWGGNAYLMEFNGVPYATGAAFLDKSDGSIINGEFIADTWGDGLDKLPYAPGIRESFKKFRKEILAIDLEKRQKEL